jgi:hypothetical protein
VLWRSLSLSQTLSSEVLPHNKELLPTTSLLVASAELGLKSIIDIFTNLQLKGSLERFLGADFRLYSALESPSSNFP